MSLNGSWIVDRRSWEPTIPPSTIHSPRSDSHMSLNGSWLVDRRSWEPTIYYPRATIRQSHVSQRIVDRRPQIVGGPHLLSPGHRKAVPRSPKAPSRVAPSPREPP